MTAQGFEFAATRLPQAKPTDQGSGSAVLTALVCDSALLCTGLRQILAGTTFVVAEGRGIPDPTPRQEQEPALIIIEAGQSSTQRLSDTVRLAKESCPAARVVALADEFDLSLVRLGLEAGVDGFCLTGSDREVLIKSLELVMLGESVLPSETIRSLLSKGAKGLLLEPQDSTGAGSRPLDPRAQKLSAREAEVLACIMDGEPNKSIARRLDVTEATVKVHVKAVLRKIGAANRTQAAIWATEHLPPNARASLNG